jgi:hypothetical protein
VKKQLYRLFLYIEYSFDSFNRHLLQTLNTCCSFAAVSDDATLLPQSQAIMVALRSKNHELHRETARVDSGVKDMQQWAVETRMQVRGDAPRCRALRYCYGCE